MKFIISRASDFIESEDVKPCKESIKIPGKKDIFERNWLIEINSIQELINFIDTYGRIIIDKEKKIPFEIPYEIIIYDDWVE